MFLVSERYKLVCFSKVINETILEIFKDCELKRVPSFYKMYSGEYRKFAIVFNPFYLFNQVDPHTKDRIATPQSEDIGEGVTTLKYENLEKDFYKIYRKTGMPYPESINKIDGGTSYRKYYDLESIKKVDEIFKEDFKRFNYNF